VLGGRGKLLLEAATVLDDEVGEGGGEAEASRGTRAPAGVGQAGCERGRCTRGKLGGGSQGQRMRGTWRWNWKVLENGKTTEGATRSLEKYLLTPTAMAHLSVHNNVSHRVNPSKRSIQRRKKLGDMADSFPNEWNGLSLYRISVFHWK
jgi:hypothetical protein